MWPFKKKKVIQPPTSPVFESVICIPGNWNDWNEFILSIVETSNGEYIAAGNILINAKNKKHYKIDFCEPDLKMKESFLYAGKVTGISNKCIEEVGAHKFVIYLSGETGNLEDAKHIAFATNIILKTGGLGVKIETAGKAFDKEKWMILVDSFDESTLYSMFVIASIVSEQGDIYSCGMQNLGLRDTILSGIDFQEAVQLISLFEYFQIIDKPIILNNHTFRADMESPIFRIKDEPNQPNLGYVLLENPFGMWRLEKE
jgi:hypothetical protein